MPNFTGNTGTLDPAGFTVGRRVFEAGARNATWHMHTAGQLVFGEAGRGRLQIQDSPSRRSVLARAHYISGGSYHWHGAAPAENFTMMFVTLGQSKTSQGDPVTEEVVLGKKNRKWKVNHSVINAIESIVRTPSVSLALSLSKYT